MLLQVSYLSNNHIRFDRLPSKMTAKAKNRLHHLISHSPSNNAFQLDDKRPNKQDPDQSLFTRLPPQLMEINLLPLI
jgi:hypothetical protein